MDKIANMINIIDNLKEIIEHIDYDEISLEEIKQKLEMAVEDLENMEEEIDEYDGYLTEEDY